MGAITKCGTGSVIPTDVVFWLLRRRPRTLREGMLVRVPQTMTVTEHFQLGCFGEVVLSADRAPEAADDVAAPGAPALLLQAQNDLNWIDSGRCVAESEPGSDRVRARRSATVRHEHAARR